MAACRARPVTLILVQQLWTKVQGAKETRGTYARSLGARSRSVYLYTRHCQVSGGLATRRQRSSRRQRCHLPGRRGWEHATLPRATDNKATVSGTNIQLPRWVNIVSSCLEVRHSETMLAQERRIAATAFGLHNVHNTQRPPGCLSGAG